MNGRHVAPGNNKETIIDGDLEEIHFTGCRQRMLTIFVSWILTVFNFAENAGYYFAILGKTFLYTSIILFGIAISTSEARTIRMVHIEAPPFYYTDKQGHTQGFLFELMKQVTKQAGYDLKAFCYPTKRMAQKLISGEADVWLGIPTIPGFENQTLIGKTEIINVRLNVYHLGNKQTITRKEDLTNTSVIVLRGYSYGGLIQFIYDPANRVTFYETDSHKAAFKMLKAGRADYLLDYKIPADRTLKSIKIPELKSVELYSIPLKFVISKKVPDATQLLETLETAFRTLVETGKIKQQ